MLTTDRQTRRLLLIGFGGLLLLLAIFGITTLSVIREIETQNAKIRDDYFNRDRILEQLRADIYLSGTYVRDLLLEQSPARADSHRQELEVARQRVKSNVAQYRLILRNEERVPFRNFQTELEAYFSSIQPALEWDAEQRRQLGYDFMTLSLLPRRATIVNLADEIASVNQRQMAAGNAQVAHLFSRFRGILIAFSVLTLLCGALLTLGSARRILRLENVSAARLNEAEHTREALRELSARLIEVQESERRSIARELHDEVGQAVSALLIGIGNIMALVPTPSEARIQLAELRLLAEKTVAVVRDMSLLLRPSMLDDLGLIPALQWQAREVSRTSKVFVEIHADSAPEELPDEYRTCIYRIVQEALRNAIRHANAKTARVDFVRKGEKLILTIHDDGQGFSPEREKGLGLLGIEERVAHLHGSFRVDSNPGEGTSIRVELPLTPYVAEVVA